MVIDVEQILYDITPSNHDLHAKELNPRKFNIKPGATAIVAEDSKVARAMLEKGLKAMDIPAQLHVTGKEAWEKIELIAQQAAKEGVPVSDKIALVLTDLEMPEMDGFPHPQDQNRPASAKYSGGDPLIAIGERQ
jgi:two-component system chemotaxis response regulator CheV